MTRSMMDDGIAGRRPCLLAFLAASIVAATALPGCSGDNHDTGQPDADADVGPDGDVDAVDVDAVDADAVDADAVDADTEDATWDEGDDHEIADSLSEDTPGDDAATDVACTTEVCDDVDNDCDGAVDEPDAADAPLWYTDADSDGYGLDGSTTSACVQPAGHSASGGDCDDALASVNPGSTEVCDGVDNDCDGEVDGADAVDSRTWYGDSDADGFGADADVLVTCEVPPGYVLTGGDCDESDPTIHPSAMEVCTNGIDEDCTGIPDDTCPVSHCGTISASETWSASITHLLTCDVLVQGAADPVLTIESGARIYADPGVNLYIGYSDHGSLSINAPLSEVTFTSSQPVPSPGDWDGITFGDYSRTTQVTGLEVSYAGGNGYGNIVLISSNPTFSFLDSTHSLAAGIHVMSSSRVCIWDSSFTDNNGDGIHVTEDSMLCATAPRLQRVVTTRNGGYPITIPAGYVGDLDLSSTFAGNGIDMIRILADVVASDATWRKLAVDYLVVGDVDVWSSTSTAHLTIADGVVIKFDPGTSFTIAVFTDFIVNAPVSGVLFTSSRPSPAAGDWDGLYLSSSGTTILDGVTVEYAGSTIANIVHSDDESNVTLTNCTIRHSLRDGFHSLSGLPSIHGCSITDNAGDGVEAAEGLSRTGTPSFRDNVITRNGGRPLLTTFAYANEIDPSCTLIGNGVDEVVLTGGTVTDDMTMPVLPVPFHVTGDVAVEDYTASGYPELTIQDGTVLEFDAGVELSIGYEDYGKLTVNGSTTGVVFTSAQPVPAPGDWGALIFGYYDRDSILTGVTIEYAGYHIRDAAVYVRSANVEFDGVTIRNSSTRGLLAEYSLPLIVRSRFLDNGQDGLVLANGSGLSDTGTPSFKNCELTGNGGYPIILPAAYVTELDSSSTFTGNDTDMIQVTADTITRNATWRDLGVPYHVSGNVDVEGSWSPELTIAAGTTMKFPWNVYLRIGYNSPGTIRAVGTPTSPILFTSYSATHWEGIYLGNNCVDLTVLFENVTVEYAGGNGSGNVVFNQCNGTIRDSVIAHSINWGIYRSSSTPMIESITYIGNVDGDLY